MLRKKALFKQLPVNSNSTVGKIYLSGITNYPISYSDNPLIMSNNTEYVPLQMCLLRENAPSLLYRRKEAPESFKAFVKQNAQETIKNIVSNINHCELSSYISTFCNHEIRRSRRHYSTYLGESLSYPCYPVLVESGNNRVRCNFFDLLSCDERIEPLPYVLPVVRKKDFNYIRLKWIATGAIDIDKIIVFVADSLHRTGGTTNVIKNFYRSVILPRIKSTGVLAYIVPQEFMLSSCFINNSIDFGDMTLFQRKGYIEDIKLHILKDLLKPKENIKLDPNFDLGCSVDSITSTDFNITSTVV